MNTVLKIMVAVKVVLLVVLASLVGYYVLPFIFKAIIVSLLSLAVLSCTCPKSKKAGSVEAIDKADKTKRFNNLGGR